MRVRICVAVLAAAALLAAGCGSVKAPPGGGSAPTPAAPATSRISVTTVIQGPGGSGAFSTVGEFDYAHARGEFRMTLPGGSTEEEVFLPGHVYLKLPAGGEGLPGGKTWLVVSAVNPEGLPFMAPTAVLAGNPAHRDRRLLRLRRAGTGLAATGQRDFRWIGVLRQPGARDQADHHQLQHQHHHRRRLLQHQRPAGVGNADRGPGRLRRAGGPRILGRAAGGTWICVTAAPPWSSRHSATDPTPTCPPKRTSRT
jgi:hypothetical protein